ncbi:hypothetical protein OEA41_010484 [Lepraria neglecta]|uniref:Uncharacterized protein n=1 Tax=Lepraria neglecta TaxID=209136 RepID=A0AAD9YZ67_9LECA|nr:hypothetical protein OEA41_010484 [Lepraria neglecta]
MFCKKLEVCDVGLPNRIAKPKKCAKCPQSIATKIAEIRTCAVTKFGGLCLDCIKNPGKSEQERKTIASEILPGPKGKDGLADSRIPRNATALALALETVTKKA